MSSRGLLLAVTAVLAVAGWLLARAFNPRPAVPSTAPTTTIRPSSSPVPPVGGTGPGSAEPDVPPPLPARDDGLGHQELWAAISDPARSDLPPALFTALTTLGVETVRADATGSPRATGDAPGGRAEACCDEITVHAAGARRYPSKPQAVMVIVVWTGFRDGVAVVEQQVSIVRLARSGQRWEPVGQR